MSAVTVRGIDPGEKSWLRCEARRSGHGILGTGSAARVYRRSPRGHAAFGR